MTKEQIQESLRVFDVVVTEGVEAISNQIKSIVYTWNHFAKDLHQRRQVLEAMLVAEFNGPANAAKPTPQATAEPGAAPAGEGPII